MEVPLQEVSEAVESVRIRWPKVPQIAIVLGSGLGGFAQEIDIEESIAYSEIRHFKMPTATGHEGSLVCGRIGPIDICAMSGRFHPYEGYTFGEATLPIRVLGAMGATMLFVSNACGGLHPRFSVGDVMVIEDQINLMFQNRLSTTTSNMPGLERVMVPSVRPSYDSGLLRLARRAARRHDVQLQPGVYCGVTGPNYETRAEIRMLRKIGADVVGMSTIAEVIVAKQLGMRVLGLSAVTNKCSPDVRVETTGDHVVRAAESTQPKMRDIVLGVINQL